MTDLQESLNPVIYAENAYNDLNKHLENFKASKIFVLVDTNTHEHCLSYFLNKISTISDIEVIEIEAGEEFKNLETCEGVWNALSELEADRKSLMINLGGGVVTDLGGFVASAFKRGINFINVPTTLLSMVDASVGGKTGVDLGNLKNQIGFIVQPEMVLIDTYFLKTLPVEEMRSGLAEILKHGLIADETYWNKVSDLASLDLSDLDDIIKESIDIKKAVVLKDPYEKNLRKTLNYGHTLGHAIESYCLTHPEKSRLLHGEAIAVGMILETYISSELETFPKEKLENVTATIKDMYGKHSFSEEDIVQIQDLMKYDKKNEHGNINFVLLEDIGKPVIDRTVPEELIKKAFHYYLNV
ncbi:3-dehydroquinate synthase [Christiangramia salexigens]|uniref:3-dehydroquinate synthase n=1 Tax=Christiangramia salexigens TaxID=1913577 RepID=A0A1L3J3E8_9FLAO|nr:3-dehydroquinate synthase [Christiangramia salexigens]APG59633.1 3-dehydroquinate synthase [Christiangramia salexigens]